MAMTSRQIANMRLRAKINKVFVSKLDIGMLEATKKETVLPNIEKKSPVSNDLVETKKLVINSFGDWDFLAYLLNTKDFKSREEFDDWAIKKHLRDNEEKSVKEISLEEAWDRMEVEVSLNMAYYCEHRDELEKDLNRQVNDLNDPRLKKELLNKQLCQLFGYDNSYAKNNDNEYMLNDFSLLENTGDSRTATAKKGEYYLKFKYYSS